MPSSTLALSPCFSTVVAALLLAPIAASAATGAAAPAAASANDPHSFARPAEARVTHLDLDLEVDFANKALSGTATLKLETKRTRRTLAIEVSADPRATTPATSRIVRIDTEISSSVRPLPPTCEEDAAVAICSS